MPTGSSVFPGGIDDFAEVRAESELVGPDVVKHAAALAAIEAELGINPAGAEATVADRLDAITAALGVPDGSITLAKLAAALKPSGSAAAADEAVRRLGTGATHAAAGDDSRFPTTGQKNALAGTAGTPGTGNEYATKQSLDTKQDTSSAATQAELDAVEAAHDARLDSVETSDAEQTVDISVVKEAPLNIEHREYGATTADDGLTHPLSERYGSLAAAQVDYPHATALTDEIDWAAMQKAINALPTGTRSGGEILLPHRYKTNRPLAIDANYVTFMGQGEGRRTALIANSASDMFTLASDGALNGFHLQSVGLISGGQGHIFAVEGDVMYSSIKNSTLEQQGTDKRIWNQPADRFIFNVFEDSHMSVPAAGTVAPFFVSSAGGFANSNSFIRGVYYGPDNYPFFYVEETSAASYAYKWLFDEPTFQICLGGKIHAYGAYGWEIRDPQDWDMAGRGASVNDGIVFGKSATGLRSVFCKVKGYLRAAGSLGSGKYDIRFEDPGAQYCEIHGGNSATLSTFAVHLGSGDHHVDLPVTGVTIDGKSSKTSGLLRGVGVQPPAVLLGTNKLSFAAVAPTAGTWVVGDRVITPDGILVCSVAGTPGTWVSETADLEAHASSTTNPHSVTKGQVGLGSADNTSDADKPVSSAQATAIALKQDASTAATDVELAVERGRVDLLEATVDHGGPSVGEETMSLVDMVAATVTLATGSMRTCFFTARRTEAITKILIPTGTIAAVAAGAGALIRAGIFSVAADESLTLIAATTSDVNAMATVSDEVEKALDVTFNKVAGTRYCYGLIVVSTAMPNTVGINTMGTTAQTRGTHGRRRKSGQVNGLADLPASVAAGAWTNTAAVLYALLKP